MTKFDELFEKFRLTIQKLYCKELISLEEVDEYMEDVMKIKEEIRNINRGI